MSVRSPGEITQLLAELRNRRSVTGDSTHSRLATLVYDELHRMAENYMRQERPDHSLQATVLVDDAYLHLVNGSDRTWQNRSHFFAVAAQAMRRILINHARSRNAAKRGGGQGKVQLDDVVVISEDNYEQILAIDEALTRLSHFDPRSSQIVEMRFYAGLTDEEIAEVLGISPKTVRRDWKVATLWLRKEFSDRKPDDSGSVAED
jgi:RNA polymerase sigma-70 factor, ECF subfamily